MNDFTMWMNLNGSWLKAPHKFESIKDAVKYIKEKFPDALDANLIFNHNGDEYYWDGINFYLVDM